jgi:hypothetical protein
MMRAYFNNRSIEFMATNPYRDFGLHPDEFGPPPSSASAHANSTKQPSSTEPQPLSNFPTPNAPNARRGSFNWGRIGMVLLAIVVVGVPKFFMHQQRQARVRADRDRARQVQQFQLPRAPQARQVQADDAAQGAQNNTAAQRAQLDKAVRQVRAQIEAARAGKQKSGDQLPGEAFNRLFGQQPEKENELPAAAEKDAE